MDNKLKQPLTKFQLNNEIKTSFEIGQVVPFFWRDTVPGDIFRNNTNFNIRFMPLIAPVMHKLDLNAHFYFVPYRLIDKNFRDVLSKPESPLTCKNLTECNISLNENILEQDNLLRAFGIHSKDGTLSLEAQKITSSYFLRAYQLVYNYFYRHEILDDDYIDDMTSDDLDNYGRKLLNIGYARHGMDYFMSNLPSTQYGSMVELDMDNNGTIRVDEMRLAEKLQYFKERLLTMARGRYKNFLDTFFGVSPTNMELQQPKYLGGGSQMLSIADIDQTANYSISGSDSPLGSQAGKINNERYGYNFNYRVEEHGIILGLCYVLPRANYIQGIPREFIKQDFYSFYNPTFANLGMQETFGCELSADRKDTFGYNDRYAELKYSKDVIAGDMTKLSSWHFGIDLRKEQLSDSFVHVKTDNQPFAVKVYKDNRNYDTSKNKPVMIFNRNTNQCLFTLLSDDIDSNNALNEIMSIMGFLFDDPDGVTQLSPVIAYPVPYEGDITPYSIDIFTLFHPVYFNNEYINILKDKYKSKSKFVDYIDKYPFLLTKKINGNYLPDSRFSNYKDPFTTIDVYTKPANEDLLFLNNEVSSNHILMQAYNNCDALRPIPKLAKPSITL